MAAGDLTQRLFSVSGKTVLVTGGSRGIGYHIARGFLEGGARVYISARKAAACNEAAARLSEHGVTFSIPADVASREGRDRLVGALTAHESGLHVLVNNAGAAWGAPLSEYPEDGWDKVLDTNVKAPFLLTQALLPLLRAAAQPDDPARVINIGSIDGLAIPLTPSFAYTASKAALHHLTRHLAAELAPDAITVNAIAPGLFESRMTTRLFDDPTVIQRIPLGRVGEFEDIAGAAIYLASRAAAWVTGAIIPVSGGSATASR